MRNLLIFTLIVLGVFTTYWFWIREEPLEYQTISLRPEEATSGDSMHPTVTSTIGEWADILGKLAPFLSVVLAFVLQIKKKRSKV